MNSSLNMCWDDLCLYAKGRPAEVIAAATAAAILIYVVARAAKA